MSFCALGWACGEDNPRPSADAGPRDAAVDAGVPADAGVAMDAGPDAGAADTGIFTATLGSRCPLPERVGVFNLSEQNGSRYLWLTFYDSPSPWFGPPALEDNNCRFYRSGWDGSCVCADDEVCDYQNTCVRAPVPLEAIELTVMGASQQTFSGDGTGALNGEVTVDGPYGLLLAVDGVQIQLPRVAVPSELTNIMGRLKGSSEMPQAAEISWDPAANGAQVYTHININHHVREPTFTECSVPASRGQFRIEGPMLVPLSVVTGLEFQGIEHVQFAAAQTPWGCLEFRLGRQYQTSLN